MDHKLAMLSKVPIFAGLGQKDLGEVGRLTEEVDLPAGHVLMREGASGSEFWVIIGGSVDVSRGGTQLRSMGAGDFLGEIALVDRGPRTATATAATPVRAFVLGAREFHSLLGTHPSIQTAVLEALAQRVRRLEPDAS